MSPKYKNRRFFFFFFFLTFSKFLRNYIREKYYDFMNNIKTEINFFEWFDKYYKPKILISKNTNSWLQKDKNTNHIYRISNTLSNTLSLIKTDAYNISDTSYNRVLTPKQ